MKIYNIVCNDTRQSFKVLDTDAQNALITVTIKNRYSNSFINHTQYRNSVKRRIKNDKGFLTVYNFSVRAD